MILGIFGPQNFPTVLRGEGMMKTVQQNWFQNGFTLPVSKKFALEPVYVVCLGI